MAKAYDVVVIGASASALAAAALLARRSWRVLVVGQGHLNATYSFGGYALRRRLFTWLGSSSLVTRRVVGELALHSALPRKLEVRSPSWQLLTPGMRLSFSEATLAAREFIASCATLTERTDALLLGEGPFPPEGFFERHRVEKALAEWPTALSSGSEAPAVLTSMRRALTYVTSHVEDPSAVAEARGFHSAAGDVYDFAGGEAAWCDMLVERVQAQGGELRLGARALRIETKRGRVQGVAIDHDDYVTSTSFVVTDLAPLEFAPLAGAHGGEAGAEPQHEVVGLRFVLNAYVKSGGLPTSLGRESFVMPDARTLLRMQRIPQTDGDLLVVETVLPSASASVVARARELILHALAPYLPFFERHLEFVDSPHDGRPLWDYRNAQKVAVPRTSLRASGGSADREPMLPRYRVAGATHAGLVTSTLRSQVGGVFHVGSTVFPALAQEGDHLAALSVARLITSTDSKRERLTRELLAKMDLG